MQSKWKWVSRSFDLSTAFGSSLAFNQVILTVYEQACGATADEMDSQDRRRQLHWMRVLIEDNRRRRETASSRLPLLVLIGCGVFATFFWVLVYAIADAAGQSMQLTMFPQ